MNQLVDLEDAQGRLSEALGYVQAGQSDPALYRMLYNLACVLRGESPIDGDATENDVQEVEVQAGVLTVRLPNLTAVRIDTTRGLIAIDGLSGWSDRTDSDTEWTVHDLRDGIYGDFHRLRPANLCADGECAASQHIPQDGTIAAESR